MYCPNCSNPISLIDEMLSVDLDGGDYYTHHCSVCPAYWHLHTYQDTVTLISTEQNEDMATKVRANLSDELRARLSRM